MLKKKLYLYDTTLRDGQQTLGVQFSTEDKTTISLELNNLGIDYIEGGWPGANPTDEDFFSKIPKLSFSQMTAFGMTKRSGFSVENDDVLSGVVNAGTASICLVGKASELHVINALKISLDDNISNIKRSINYLVSLGREALFDAEHFFDGYKANPEYGMRVVKTAFDAGARWIVLCDTNGGTLPDEIITIVKKVIDSGIPGESLGIHAHDDTGNAVANSLAAVKAGVCQVQGTLNGLGERCGNANLTTIIPTLLLKEPFASNFDISISHEGLTSLTRVSRVLDDILNRIPNRSAPYVGASAFTHKAGLHASAVIKDPTTYEHIAPNLVGNKRVVPMSNQAGKSNLMTRLTSAGIDFEPKDSRLLEILREIKIREDKGFSYDLAQASFELLALKVLGNMPEFFTVERYRVTMERRRDERKNSVTLSEAVVVLKIGDKKTFSVSESMDDEGSDRGPVNALANAISKDLGPYQDVIDDIKLVDFKVRITSGGVGAVTRVLIDSEDSQGVRWSTVGVSANIIDASFQALIDAINWKLFSSGVKPV